MTFSVSLSVSALESKAAMASRKFSHALSMGVMWMGAVGPEANRRDEAPINRDGRRKEGDEEGSADWCRSFFMASMAV